jgi:large subunit ribosomal protein L13e
LRPAVRGQTVKYNRKLRAGRGFSLQELKQAGFNAKAARGLGIAVDHRRRNRSEEGLKKNVDRLKSYRSKLVVFPRNSTSQRVKKGDSSAADRKAVAQQSVASSFPIAQDPKRTKARKITDKEKDFKAAATARKATTDAKRWGAREKRAKDKAEAAKAPKAQAVDDAAMGDE